MKHIGGILLFCILVSLSFVSADCNGNSTTCNGFNDTLSCSSQAGCYWSPTNNSTNGFNHLSLIIILVALATLFAFVGSTINERKWLMKSAMYFVSLAIMIICVAVGLQITESYNLNRLMYTALVVAIIAFSVFIAFIFIDYFVNIVKAVRDAKEQKKSELD